MQKVNFLKITEEFPKKKILVIGDLILDKYLIGDSSRISPEAPIPVVLVNKEEYFLGGAANVANNISSLGANVDIAGIIGQDICGDIFLKLLNERNIKSRYIIKSQHYCTTEKTRVIARGQQIVRFDKENYDNLDYKVRSNIVSTVTDIIANYDIIIFSDYAKGFFDKKTATAIIDCAKKYNISVIGDIKPQNKDFFSDISYITPNLSEAMLLSGESDKIKAGKKIQKMFNCNTIITEGANGMTIFENDNIFHIPTEAAEVYDIVGAGDTVLATFSLALAAGLSSLEAAYLANVAAGIVVGKFGTATVSSKELQDKLINFKSIININLERNSKGIKFKNVKRLISQKLIYEGI